MQDKQKFDDSLFDEIELRDIVEIIWLRKALIILFAIFAFSISFIVGKLLPDIYTSSSVLAPLNESNSNNTYLNDLSGLADLAGISAPSNNTRSMEAKEVLASFTFFSKNIKPNIKLQDLVAIDSWDKESNSIQYDKNLFNPKDQVWIGDGSVGGSRMPSDQSSFKEFKDIFIISQDKDTSFITLSVSHQSPFVAEQILQTVIYEINNKFRQEDKKRASLSIEFLNNQIGATNISEIKQALSRLLQIETQKLMLIEANEEYVFKVLDPPIVKEIKSSPNRIIIYIVGFLTGILIGVIYALLNHYFKK